MRHASALNYHADACFEKGCCQSTLDSGEAAPSPRGAQATNSPRRAIRNRLANRTLSDSTNTQPTSELRRPRPWRLSDTSDPTVPRSRAALIRERTIFFETRVTGHAEVWQAVKIATEMVREQDDLAGAQGLLEAAGCTIPRGYMDEGVWDERGVLYMCPQWVCSDPVDMPVQELDDEGDTLLGTGGDRVGDKDTGDSLLARPHDTDGIREDEKSGAARRANDKGKGKYEETVKLRARLSDRGTDVVVEITLSATVNDIISQVQEQVGSVGDPKIRLAYLGKILKDNQSLTAQGWQRGHVVNALVYQ